jgi:hypothetical protein
MPQLRRRLPLPAEKRTQITSAIRQEKVEEVTNANVNLSIGTAVPAGVRYYPMPSRIVEIYPEWRDTISSWCTAGTLSFGRARMRSFTSLRGRRALQPHDTRLQNARGRFKFRPQYLNRSLRARCCFLLRESCCESEQD